MIDAHELHDAMDSLVSGCDEAGNLRYAFVAGSRASGRARPDSDVDFFVVLNEPSIAQEHRMAQTMRRLHDRHGLAFAHCGEILTLDFLNRVFSGTVQLTALVEHGFTETPCFAADCVLSAARKYLVILGMLAGPKIQVRGDARTLDMHSRLASAFFEDIPETIMPPHDSATIAWDDNAVDDPLRERWMAINRRVAAGLLDDSPLGIDLDRWFGHIVLRSPTARWRECGAPGQGRSFRICPLREPAVDTGISEALRSQCIGATIPSPICGK